MKIAAFYAYHNLDCGWSCPISLLNEFERIGHQVYHYNLYKLDENGNGIGNSDEELIKLIDEQDQYDMMLHMDYGSYYSSLFANIRIPKTLEAGDDYQAFRVNFAKAQFFDYIFTPDKNCYLKYKEVGFNVIWLTHWADTTIHFPYSDVDTDKLVVTTCDEDRGNGIIKYLKSKLDPGLWLDDRFYYANDHSKFMCRGKIVFQKSKWGEITRRPFEAAACKRMVMMDELDENTGIYDIFKPNIDAIYYRNHKDALDKINYYSTHLDELDEIANNGYKKVINGHTQIHRAKALLKFWGY